MSEQQHYERTITESLGESEVFLEFQQQLSRAARVDRPVLIIGERGSGKELAASRLHYLSERWQQPFVTINCAALPPSLIETELFGHEAGAFTGATKSRKGRFEEANHGTLFLDEIGLIPLEVQEKILRVVEYGTFERVGSSKTHEVDTRIIGATNADLPLLCEEGKFKQDLLDRLSFEVLFLPPLRERREDILFLAGHFINRMALETGRDQVPELSPEVSRQLLAYSWPGNIRELKNTVERAVYRTDGDVIYSVTIDPFRNPYRPAGKGPISHDSGEHQEKHEASTDEDFFNVGILPLQTFQEARDDVTIHFLKRALREAKGVQRQAAVLLGLTYDQFRVLYRKHRDALGKEA